MSQHLVITVIANDRPGIVEQLAQALNSHQGNWLESSFSRLGGKFAGILRADVPLNQSEALQQTLANLSAKGIRVSIEIAEHDAASDGTHLQLSVVGNDRRGIVGEISQLLARSNTNVVEMTTLTENAPMSGDLLFHLNAEIVLPSDLSREDLQLALEDLSADLMVELDELE